MIPRSVHTEGKSRTRILFLFDKQLTISDQERDLGVIVDNKLKFGEQCDSIVSKATLGMIKRNNVSRNHNIITKFYKTLVRPKLEYCIQAWRPYLRKMLTS